MTQEYEKAMDVWDQVNSLYDELTFNSAARFRAAHELVWSRYNVQKMKELLLPLVSSCNHQDVTLTQEEWDKICRFIFGLEEEE